MWWQRGTNQALEGKCWRNSGKTSYDIYVKKSKELNRESWVLCWYFHEQSLIPNTSIGSDGKDWLEHSKGG